MDLELSDAGDLELSALLTCLRWVGWLREGGWVGCEDGCTYSSLTLPPSTVSMSVQISLSALDAAVASSAAAASAPDPPPDLIALRGTAQAVRAMRAALLAACPEDARRMAVPLQGGYARIQAALGGSELDSAPLPLLAPEAAVEVACVFEALQLLALRRATVTALQVGTIV